MENTGTLRVSDLDGLPTLPSVVIEAIQLLEGEESNFDAVASLLRNDQVLAGRILHYANSPYLGVGRDVASISQAVSVLGFDLIRRIILSASIFETFSDDLPERRRGLLNFWLHTIGVAVTAEFLARRLGFPLTEEAYVAGLLHDLGKLVCFNQDPARFETLRTELERQGSYSTTGTLPLDLERAILGTTHVEVGRLIADQWGIPDTLGRVMWLHHQPSVETILPEASYLPQLIRFADILCVTHHVGSSYFLPSGTYCHEHFHFGLETVLRYHHLTPEDIDGLMDEVYDQVRGLGDVFGLWDDALYRELVGTANVRLGAVSMDLERNNRALAQANRVLDVTCRMSREISPGLALSSAAGAVTAAAEKAFGVQRALCLIRDEANGVFTGQISEGGRLREIRVPMHLTRMRSYAREKAGTELEAEAVERLASTRARLTKGAALESGVMDMVAGSNFLSTFFAASRSKVSADRSILGEFMMDCSGLPDISGDAFDDLQRHFEIFAVTAGAAVEKLLLEQELTRQTGEMAEASRKVEESQRQLFHSHRLATVGQLAAGAAHEINNPLTILSLNVQLMEVTMGDREQNPTLWDKLRIISDQIQRIEKIIQDLMGFARPGVPKLAAASLSAIIDRVLEVVGSRVFMGNINVDNRVGEGLPQILVDPLQIEQVFMNLIINAAHAMPSGGSITVEAEARDGHVEARVTDTGTGIDPKHLSKIFDPFFTTKKEGEGTGLGLAICHSIVEHNGGAMRVQSALGVGSTFMVRLPVDKGEKLRTLRGRLDQPAPVSAVDAGCRILVVDDEAVLNNMVQESLRNAGYEADGAYDGMEAVRLLRQNKYRLVILDIRMPRMDGVEVMQFIKEEFPNLPVLIITALASQQEIQDAGRLGAYACIKKPFRLTKVLEMVTKALKAYRRPPADA